MKFISTYRNIFCSLAHFMFYYIRNTFCSRTFFVPFGTFLAHDSTPPSNFNNEWTNFSAHQIFSYFQMHLISTFLKTTIWSTIFSFVFSIDFWALLVLIQWKLYGNLTLSVQWKNTFVFFLKSFEENQWNEIINSKLYDALNESKHYIKEL